MPGTPSPSRDHGNSTYDLVCCTWRRRIGACDRRQVYGQSRGFGFVEMSTQGEAPAAMTALNGTQMDGRSLTVTETKPMEPRSGGGGRFSEGGRGRNRY